MINAQKFKILLHSQIEPTQIQNLIMRWDRLVQIFVSKICPLLLKIVHLSLPINTLSYVIVRLDKVWLSFPTCLKLLSLPKTLIYLPINTLSYVIVRFVVLCCSLLICNLFLMYELKYSQTRCCLIHLNIRCINIYFL